jgi:hypothetical protein
MYTPRGAAGMSIRTSLCIRHIKYKIVYYNSVGHNIHGLNLIKVNIDVYLPTKNSEVVNYIA